MPTTEAAPKQDYGQQMAALQRANDVRSRRAELKKDLKAGRKRARVLVLDPPDWTLTMRVGELLLAQPKCGRVKVNRTLNQCRMGPNRTLGALTDRQRVELVRELA